MPGLMTSRPIVGSKPTKTNIKSAIVTHAKTVESELIVLVDQVCGCAQAVIQNMFWLFAPTMV